MWWGVHFSSHLGYTVTFICIIIYGLLSEINWMDGWMDMFYVNIFITELNYILLRRYFILLFMLKCVTTNILPVWVTDQPTVELLIDQWSVTHQALNQRHGNAPVSLHALSFAKIAKISLLSRTKCPRWDRSSLCLKHSSIIYRELRRPS